MTSESDTKLRPCGDCTACCQGWLTSHTMKLRPGSACEHCSASGCGIYADRPQDPCRDFHCAWSHPESGLPEDMRPDRCGAILKWKHRWRLWEPVTALPVGARVPEETLERLVEYARERSQPLFFSEHQLESGKFGGSKLLAVGPPEFMDEVKKGVNQQDIWQF